MVALERAGKVSEQRDDVVQQIGCVSLSVAVREQHFGQVFAKTWGTGERGVGRARGAEGVKGVRDVGIAGGGRGAVGGAVEVGVTVVAAGREDSGVVGGADGGVVVALGRVGVLEVTGGAAGLAGVVTVAVEGLGVVPPADVVADVDGGVVVAVPGPHPSGQAAGAGERAVEAAIGAVGVVADVDGGVVAAGAGTGVGASDQVGVPGEGAVLDAGLVGTGVGVVADVDGGVVIRASIGGFSAGEGESVGAACQGIVAGAAGGAGVAVVAVGDRQAILPRGGFGAGAAAAVVDSVAVERDKQIYGCRRGGGGPTQETIDCRRPVGRRVGRGDRRVSHRGPNTQPHRQHAQPSHTVNVRHWSSFPAFDRRQSVGGFSVRAKTGPHMGNLSYVLRIFSGRA